MCNDVDDYGCADADQDGFVTMVTIIIIIVAIAKHHHLMAIMAISSTITIFAITVAFMTNFKVIDRSGHHSAQGIEYREGSKY